MAQVPIQLGIGKQILKFMANNSWGLIFFIEIRWWHELEKLGAAGRARKKYWLWKFTASKNPNGPPFWLLCTYLPESKMRLHNRRQNVQTAAKNQEAWINNFPQSWIFGTRMYQYWVNWFENETLICAFHITNTEALYDSRFFFAPWFHTSFLQFLIVSFLHTLLTIILESHHSNFRGFAPTVPVAPCVGCGPYGSAPQAPDTPSGSTATAPSCPTLGMYL